MTTALGWFFMLSGVGIWAIIALFAFMHFAFPCPPLTEQARDRILQLVAHERMSGRDIQNALRREGLMDKRSRGVAFYSAMAAMEDALIVTREVDDEKVGDIAVKVTYYQRRPLPV